MFVVECHIFHELKIVTQKQIQICSRAWIPYEWNCIILSVNMNSTTISYVKYMAKNLDIITYSSDNFFSEESIAVFDTCTDFDKFFNNSFTFWHIHLMQFLAIILIWYRAK